VGLPEDPSPVAETPVVHGLCTLHALTTWGVQNPVAQISAMAMRYRTIQEPLYAARFRHLPRNLCHCPRCRVRACCPL